MYTKDEDSDLTWDRLLLQCRLKMMTSKLKKNSVSIKFHKFWTTQPQIYLIKAKDNFLYMLLKLN